MTRTNMPASHPIRGKGGFYSGIRPDIAAAWRAATKPESWPFLLRSVRTPTLILILSLLTLQCLPPALGQNVDHDVSGNLSAIRSGNGSPPAILLIAAARTGIPGQPVGFSLKASGSAPLKFEWAFNGSVVPGARTDTLLIVNLSAASVGDYRVTVSNPFGSVTSAVIRVDMDANRDGLPDGWEKAFFGSLTNQIAAGDFDHDGISNLQEFMDGTNPANAISLQPRLELWSVGGAILVAPDRGSYSTNQLLTLIPVPDPGLSFIGWTGDLTGATNPAALVMNGNKTVFGAFGVPLEEALGATNQASIGGWAGWIGSREESHDGRAAAVTAPALYTEPTQTAESWMEVRVNMKVDGTASFWWRTDAPIPNSLRLFVNGNYSFQNRRTLSGVTPWQKKTIYLAAGIQTIRWLFHRETAMVSPDTEDPGFPADNGYVDELVFNEYADPLIDTDGNGLADLWEYRYFDQLGNDPRADADKDGVSNSLEFGDGTDPGSSSSVFPRITIGVEGGGVAQALPLLAILCAAIDCAF